MSKLMPPDLQTWINAAGGYHLVDWKAWHTANAEYEQSRRDQLLSDLGGALAPTPQPQRKAVASRRRDAIKQSRPVVDPDLNDPLPF
jgi:hypothetical protein